MKIEVNEIELTYDFIGEAAPPLLLLHGFGLNRTIWHAMAESYLGNHQVIIPDMRGHGESDVPPGPYFMDLMARDMAGLLDHLDVQKAIVCGHSMGGYVALAFADKFPERLAGLGLITTNATADSNEKRTGRYDQIKQIRLVGSRAVADSLAPRLSKNTSVVNCCHALISQCQPGGLIGSLQGMAEREEKTDTLARIGVPALVVAGEEDLITDLATARAEAAQLPQGEFLQMPGVGHMPMLENPDGLGQALQSLIARVILISD